MMAEVSLRGDWGSWRAGAPIEILRPEHTYEGTAFPLLLPKKEAPSTSHNFAIPSFLRKTENSICSTPSPVKWASPSPTSK